MTVTFECWGDSHLDDTLGIGARKALQYECLFDQRVSLVRNQAKAGARVSDWITNYFGTPAKAQILVVSSGWNEAVAIALGWTTVREVKDFWYLLIKAAESNGQRVLWVPTQFTHGRAGEFPALEELHISPLCLGATLLDWNPAADEMCPDGVHYSYLASHRLALAIIDRVAEMGGL